MRDRQPKPRQESEREMMEDDDDRRDAPRGLECYEFPRSMAARGLHHCDSQRGSSVSTWPEQAASTQRARLPKWKPRETAAGP